MGQDRLVGAVVPEDAPAARVRAVVFAFAAIAVAFFSSAAAQATCVNVAGSPLRYAALDVANDARKDEIRLTFLGHASFEIETPEGARAVTDYNGYLMPEKVPHVVTMNNSHRGHFTPEIDSRIPHMLRGWNPDGVTRHDVTVKDLHVRSVPTNLSDWGGKVTMGNSIFVFEALGICIAHISHVHHALSDDQIRELGIVDVALVAIDGAVTMSHEELFEALSKLKPRLVVPMHMISYAAVQRFLALAEPHFPIRRVESDTVYVSNANLPQKPEVLLFPLRP
jgi:L-ascorbate metabolism protein UlaG (beta-lactamase superfamily)